MNTAGRLGAFGLAALFSLAGGAAIGAAVGPINPAPSGTHGTHESDPMPATAIPANHGGHGPASVFASSYRIATDGTLLSAGVPQRISFRVVDGSNSVVTKFEDRHERPMHLIVISTDVTNYAHLHPSLNADGVWTVELPGLTPGGYRLIADTVPVDGPDLALSFDAIVPGPAPERPAPEPAATVAVGDLAVDLDLAPSSDGRAATLTVRRGATPIIPDPYLGARGHLVAIALDDLAYLHVHPETDDDAPDVAFAIADPPPGWYRLFFDFSVDGTVHTAAFTVNISVGDGHR